MSLRASGPDFFERQELAQNQSRVLFLFFLIAVLAVVVGSLFVVWIVDFYFVRQVSVSSVDIFDSSRGLEQTQFLARALADLDFTKWSWDRKKIYIFVSILTVGLIFFGSFLRRFELGRGSSRVAEILGAQKVPRSSQNPEELIVNNVVEEMALAAAIPVPSVYVIPGEQAINAFAAGTAAENCWICVTEGLLKNLNREEIQAVIGHETSHLLFGDSRLNLELSCWLHGVFQVSNFGRFLLRVALDGRSGRFRSNRKSVVGGALPLLFIGFGVFIVGGVGWLVGCLLRAGVSRQREFLADASAVRLTRNPEGLLGALRKIQAQSQTQIFFRHPQGEDFSHMYFSSTPVLSGYWGSSRFLDWLSSHPPLTERIRWIGRQSFGDLASPSEEINSREVKTLELPRNDRKALSFENLVLAQGLLQGVEEILGYTMGRPWRSQTEAIELLFSLLVPSPRSKLQDFNEAKNFLKNQGYSINENFVFKRHELGAQKRILFLRLVLGSLKEILSVHEKERLLAHVGELFRSDGNLTLRELMREWIFEKELGILEPARFANLSGAGFVREISVAASIVCWNVTKFQFNNLRMPPPPPVESDLQKYVWDKKRSPRSPDEIRASADEVTSVGPIASRKYYASNPAILMQQRKKLLQSQFAKNLFEEFQVHLNLISPDLQSVWRKLVLLDLESVKGYRNLRDSFLRLRSCRQKFKQDLLLGFRKLLFPVGYSDSRDPIFQISSDHPDFESRLEILWGLAASLDLPYPPAPKL